MESDMKIGDIDANGLRRGSEILFEAPPGYRVEAILPPVLPHYPEELLVLAPTSKEGGGAQLPKSAYDPASILERSDALVEATVRHRKRSKEVLATLGYDM